MHEWILFVLLTASALHVVEEHAMGWQGWASRTLGSRLGANPSWTDFWATNGLLVVFGASAALVGWRAPAFALGFAALVLINAVGFHVLPSLAARRVNPGCISAVVLYLPLGIWAYAAAAQDDVLSAATLLGSIAIGAVAMASAVLMLALQPRLRYPDV